MRLFVEDCLSAIFDDICVERMWIRESLFNLEKGYEDVWGAEILGMWVPGGGGL